MKNKVAITGSSGFLGGNISLILSQSGCHCFPVKRKTNTSFEDLSSFTECDSIIHLAAKVHDLKGLARKTDFFDSNLELTKEIYDFFLSSNCQRFIFFSSIAAVTSECNDVLLESDHPEPTTLYGKSKLAAEQYILSKSLPKNKRVYILRPSMVHGPNNKGNLNLLVNIIRKGVPYPLGLFKNKRSFTSVDNVSFVVKELLENEIESGIYNLADDTPLSTESIVRMIGDVNNQKARIWNVPCWIVKLAAHLGDGMKLPFNTVRLSKLTDNYIVSNAKIKAAIGKELPVSAEEGLMKTLKSFK